MIRNNHAREGGCDGDKEAKRDKAGRLVKSDRIYCLHEQIFGQKMAKNFVCIYICCGKHRSFFQINFRIADFSVCGENPRIQSSLFRIIFKCN